MAFTRDLITRLNGGGMTSAMARDLKRCILASLASLSSLSYKWLLCMGLGVGSSSSVNAIYLEDNAADNCLYIVAASIIYNYIAAAVSAASLERNGTKLKSGVVGAIALLSWTRRLESTRTR